MKIVHVDEAFLTMRPENYESGWWIVDPKSDTFFDGPYPNKEEALERYEQLPGRLREVSPFG